MGLFQNLSTALERAAAQGEETAKHVMQQILAHPEVVALGLGPLPLGANADRRAPLRADREQLLVRVSDLLRRGGTEDAERLIRELETAIGGPVFSAGGDFMFAFHAAIPEGDIPSDRPILQFLDPAHCAAFTTYGVFPFPFDCREIHAGVQGAPEVPASALHFRYRAMGVEVARFPMNAFTGPFALAWERRYSPRELHEIELWATRQFHATVPWSVGLVLSGNRA